MERIKRVLAIMLVLTMILSLGEAMAFASEVPEDTTSSEISDGVNGDENVVGPGEEDVDPGASSGEGGKVTDGETEGDDAPPPDDESSAPPADTNTEETEPTATPEPTVTPEPSAEPTVTPEPTATPAPEHKEWPWTEPGNDMSTLVSGGYSLAVGDSLYYSERGCLYLDDTLLVQVDARGLNLCDGMLYYAAGNTIYRMPSGGGEAETVYTAEGAIDQMYVMGQEIRFLSEGVVYSYDMSWTEDEIAPVDMSAPEEEAPPADTEEAPPADTTDESDDAQQEDGGVAPAASLPGNGFSINMEDVGLEPSETETEIVTGTAQATGPLETLEGPADVKKFVPTPYGNLFLTGELFHYTLSTATAQICSDVKHCYPDGDWLVVYNGNGDPLQTPLADALNGSVNLQEYNLHQDAFYNEGASDEEILAEQAEYFASDAYEATLEGREEYNDNGIMTVANIASTAVSGRNLTVSQRNIVLRAQQMSEVTWVPKKSIYAWGGDNPSYVSGKAEKRSDKAYLKDASGTKSSPDGTFVQGRTYRGVPYSQPVNTNGYVGYGISLSDFLTQTNNAGSKLYSSYSYYSSTAPYYGSDCSAFVSWAWGIGRQVCSTLGTYSTSLSNGKTITTELQVGDILNNPHSHVLLVTDIGYDADGKIVSVELTEQTPPKMTVTCYGELLGKRYDYHNEYVNTIVTSYLDQGYTIYHRRASLPAVTAPPTVQGIGSVATPTMTVTPKGPDSADVTFNCTTSGAKIRYTMNADQPTSSTGVEYSKAISVTSSDLSKDEKNSIIFQAVAAKDNQTSLAMSAEVNAAAKPKLTLAEDGSAAPLSDGIYYVEEGKNLSLKAAVGATIYYTTGGEEPTLSSNKVTSGTASISLDTGDGDEMTIKAFAVVDGDIPSKVETFTVKKGTIWTVTLDDPFGFLTLKGTSLAVDETNHLMQSKQYVLDNTTLEVEVKEEVDIDADGTKQYKLKEIEVVNGGEAQTRPDNSSFQIENIKSDIKITAKVATSFEDLYDKADKEKTGYAWFTNAVEYGTQQGLVHGAGNNKFDPYGYVTRMQFMTFLGRLADPKEEISGVEVTGQTPWENHNFPQLAITRGESVPVRSKAGDVNGTPDAVLEATGQWLEMEKLETKLVNGTPWYYVKYKDENGGDHKGFVSSLYSGQTIVQACPFTDFTDPDTVGYAYGYSQWGYLHGIVSGTYPTLFSPKALMNREDLCCLLYKYVTSYLGLTMDTSNRLDEFEDANTVRDYAKPAVNAMINAGIVNGKTIEKDGTVKTYICPRGTASNYIGFATRAEAVTMFMRLDKYLKSMGR